MFSFFRSRPVTVDAAIAPLLKAIDDLDQVADSRNTRCFNNRQEITRLEAVITEDQAELERAEVIAKMIRAITEPKE